MKQLIESIVVTILGIVILAVSLTGDAPIAPTVIGGLFTVAGIVWLIEEIINMNKK